jgi:alcohol dehydrogenase class IV
MPYPFDFFAVPRTVFGRGTVARVPEMAATLGLRPLIVYNGDDALADVLAAKLDAADLRTSRRRQRGEPTVADVDSAVEQAKRDGSDCVIGLGGGSAIDAAKAVAGLMTNGGVATDYMEVVGLGLKITRAAAPWMAIPTTAGTGAEATRNAVVGLPERKFKASIRSELLLPRVALIDPELGVNVPPAVTAASGMDALCQLIESFTSSGAQPITDALALRGMELAARSLRRAYEDGRDLAARTDMAIAANLSGVTLTNAGLGAVHGFAAPLGANFPVPHGVVCAALLPHVIRVNVEAARSAGGAVGRGTLQRYAAVGRSLVPAANLAEDEAIAACVAFTADLARDLRIPPLSTYGLTPQHVPDMVALAKKASSMRFNPVILSDDVLAKVLTTAIGTA